MLRRLTLLLALAAPLAVAVSGEVAAQTDDDGHGHGAPVAAADTTAEVDDSWDVSAAHGPTETVRFTTTEGTWMNLDVSPDGTRIVFDLVGDLYTLPIAGGTARRITSGPAFDLQPRWSPDGSRIAFTSDRAGGDNVWTMSAAGDDFEQVTDEDFRLLNNAVWTPDGDYLIARKHFTSGRSSAPARCGCTTGPAAPGSASPSGATTSRTPASPPSRPTAATSTSPRT